MEHLKRWFLENRRELPWRENPTPYRVWISEVMLQQTRASVVVPYFERFMHTFPTIEALAAAPVEQVIKCWEGLGYYTRARNLHAGAKQIVETFESHLPQTAEALSMIKGIGPYTQGAILSFAFHKRAFAIDGNVKRVLARYFTVETGFEEKLDQILPHEESWIVSEALIELGATHCNKKAQCTGCPLQKDCLAYRDGLQEEFPKKCKRPSAIDLVRTVGVIECDGHILVRKGQEGKVMADLFEFPYLEGEVDPLNLSETLGLDLHNVKPLDMQKHSFTRYRVRLFPFLLRATTRCTKFIWQEKKALSELPFSSGHRRIMQTI